MKKKLQRAFIQGLPFFYFGIFIFGMLGKNLYAMDLKNDELKMLQDLYIHSVPSEIRIKILLEANYDLQDMENLMLGALPEQLEKQFLARGKDERYKLWAFQLGEKLKEKNSKSLYYKVQQDFRRWAWKKRESVERQLGMPKAGSAEEEPYLFKKGWFDASPDPNKPLPYFNDHDFFLSDFITQEVWVEVMGENPSEFPNKFDCPEDDLRAIRKLRPGKDGKHEIKQIKYCKGWAVTDINLYDARKFVHIMNMGSAADVKYDIPTEWQFDLAARGGLVSETKDGISNTGRFGSLEVTDLETFQTKIPWIGDRYKGRGRTNQKPPFPRTIGPHDLIGHLWTWTKSLALAFELAGQPTPYKTKQIKNWGLDWNLEEIGSEYKYPRFLRGRDLNDLEYHFSRSQPDNWNTLLGLRLLRTGHELPTPSEQGLVQK